MNRTDRLYAVTEELRRVAPGGVTAQHLARMLEVSARTVKRDVLALQEAGAPIWAQTGVGGGYFLSATASLPPVNFTPAQAVAVAIALAVMPPGSPFSPDASSAAAKVRDALAPTQRAMATSLAQRVWVLTPHDSKPAAGSTVLRAVERSLIEHRVLAISYADDQLRRTRRRVEPVLLAWTHRRWYLVAWCQLRNDTRWFQLNRVGRADLTPERFEPRAVAEVGEPPADAAPVAPSP